MGSVLVAVSVQPPNAHVRGLLRSSPPQQKQQTATTNDPPSQLRPGLCIGSKDTEKDLQALNAAGITHILQAGVELEASHPSHQQQFQYRQLACSDTDTQDIVSLFRQAFSFIDEGCQQGNCVLCLQ